MKNYVGPGLKWNTLAPYALTSGQGFQVGVALAIALSDAANGAAVVGLRSGESDQAKATGEAWTAGALVYWDNTNKRLTTTVATNKLWGFAVQAQASGDTIGRAMLTGQVS